MAASTEGYHHRADAIKNVHDATGIVVNVSGRKQRYRWTVWRTLGTSTTVPLP